MKSDRERLIEIIDNRWGYFDSGKLADDLIENGVEIRKFGFWLRLDDCANDGIYCSVCRKKVYKSGYSHTMAAVSKYCPNCGTKMSQHIVNT